MNRMRRIGLLIGTEFAYGRNVWRGVREYSKPLNRPWLFRGVRYNTRDPDAVKYLASWKPDGIIAHVFREDMIEPLLGLSIPVVNTSNSLAGLALPRAGVDDVAIGQAAAEYFIRKGFKHFAFMGSRGIEFSARRAEGFAARLAERGIACQSYHGEDVPASRMDRYSIWRGGDEDRRVWLGSLPKPAALFVCNDDVAVAVSELCSQARLRVPEDVSILGADDDELLCEFSAPPLSSVRVPSQRIGLEAARLLDRLLTRKSVPAGPVLLPPSGVSERQSTDLLVISDAEVAGALRFIREHVGDRINVEDVAREVSICRSLLERRFRTLLHRSPLEEITRVRIERTQELLAYTDLSMPEIAATAGYRDGKHLHAVFARETGMAPTEYRRQYRAR